MAKLVFSSEDLPADLDDAARFALWRDLYIGTICHFDVKRLTDRPFTMRYEFANFGEVALASCAGTINEIKRTTHHVANDPNDNFFLAFNGVNPWSLTGRGFEWTFAPHSCAFLGGAEVAAAQHHE